MHDFKLRYDRRVSKEMLEVLLSGGFAHSLLEYASARYPIDLQCRKDYKTKSEWITLYVGMTKVVDLHRRKDDLFLLSAHEAYSTTKNRWDPDWVNPHSREQWADLWPHVELYLEQIIPHVMGTRLIATEGAVQAAASVYRADPARAMLDREVTPSFHDKPAKKAIIEGLYAPLVNALASGAPVMGKPPTTLGAYCDLLAVDATGQLVAIEIKPGKASSLKWVPAQATMYAKVLQAWIDDDPDWAEVITGSFAQRKALGLTPAHFTLPTLQRKVVPAVAYQRIASEKLIQQMYDVQDHLVACGVGDPEMTFYTVSISGRLDQVNSANG